MARRKSNSEDGINLDSLMDALTNVVAVLILVLLLVQADVKQKVVKFLEDLEPATPEQVAETKKTLQKLNLKKTNLYQLLSQDAPSEKEVEEESRQLFLLETNLTKNEALKKQHLLKLEELKKLSEKAKSDRELELDKTQKITTEIANLEALLDSSPVIAVKPTEVRIPSSRPLPKNAKIYHAIAKNDRVHFIDPFTPLEIFEKEFRKKRTKFPRERIKKNGETLYIYEPAPIKRSFKNNNFKNFRNQKVALFSYPTWTRFNIRITPDFKTGGTSLKELQQNRGIFLKVLRKIKRDSKAVLLFSVHPDSFNTYLEARRLTDKAKIPAGWSVSNRTTYDVAIKNVEIKRLQTPPPPDPNKPKPKPKPKPPKLKPKLD